MDENVAKAQAKNSGLDRQQWAAALERISGYLGATKNANGGDGGGGRKDKGSKSSDSGSSGAGGSGGSSGSGATIQVGGFSKVELEALEKRLERIRAAFLNG
jgi:hypothetical protein